MKLHSLTVAVIAMSTLSVACSDKSDDDTGTDVAGEEADADADYYDFDSQFVDDASSVSNTGQIMRQALLTEMKGYIGDLTDMIDGGRTFAEGDIVSGLMFYFDFDSADAGEGFYYAPDNALQTTWGDISTKNLKGKLAGNDSTTDHRPWTDQEDGTLSEFSGFPAEGVTSPETLVMHWFNEIEDQALLRADGDADALANPVFVTPDGVDRQQLIQKFLTGAVTFSQGADDYMDDDIDGKGLKAGTDCAKEDDDVTCKKYSGLEHAWDEGFGYFGGARNYGQLTAAEIKANENDADGDGMIDLIKEYNWGASVNAAKRDVGSAELSAATDLVGEAWEGFYGGRAIIAAASHDVDGLTDAEMDDLKAHRDMAIGAWEKAIAATVVHYINDVRADIYSCSPMSGSDFSFGDFAKHWGEAKGFGLWFQFNPNSPMTDAQFEALHEALGQTAPKWKACDEPYESWYAELEEARTLLGEVYGFDAELLENW